MKKVFIASLLCLPVIATAADDITARKNFAKELAGCAAFYSVGAQSPGLDKKVQQQLADKSRSAIGAAMSITDRQYALTKEQEAISTGEGMNGPHCDEVMANPNQRFAYWRGL